MIRDTIEVMLDNVQFIRGKNPLSVFGAIPVRTVASMYGYFVDRWFVPPKDYETFGKVKMSEDQNMVWVSSDQFGHGSLYRVDPNGNWITPGAPKGEIRQFQIIPSNGIVYVLLAFVPKGYSVGFPTVQDLTSFFGLSAVRYDNWSLNSAARPVDDAMNYQSRNAPSNSMRVLSYTKVPIKSWLDTGFTSLDIQRNLSQHVPLYILNNMLRKDTRLIIWRVSSNDASVQWVQHSECDFLIGGPSVFGISHKRMSEWFSTFEMERSCQFTFDPGNSYHYRFLNLLRMNYFHVVEDHTDVYSVCRVKFLL